ncbi:MAG: TonB family protein [Steroidobacteraceae bacterium]
MAESESFGRLTSGAATALLAALLSAATCEAAESVPPVGPESMRVAVEALRSGNEAKAVPMLERNALAGDSRAQYLVGVAYFTGKALPVNKPLGFAWLEIAADATGGYADWSSKQAVDTMLEVQPHMSDRDLLEADRLLPSLTNQIQRTLEEALRPALKLYSTAPVEFDEAWIRFLDPEVQISMPTGPSSHPLVVPGCGDVEHTNCPAHRETGSGPACTGRILQADTAPTILGGESKIVQPSYPVGARRDWSSGRVKVLMHVDASGWVCSATLAESSGDPALDRAAVDASRLWRINPARAAGRPVESLYTVGVEFVLH